MAAQLRLEGIPSIYAQTDELIAQIQESLELGFEPVITKRGNGGGSWVVKELVYAYAMRVSPAFHLKVIRFFDRGVKDGVAVADNAAADLPANLEGRALETSKSVS